MTIIAFQNVSSIRTRPVCILLNLVYQPVHLFMSLDFGFFRHTSSKMQLALKIFSFIKLFLVCTWFTTTILLPRGFYESFWVLYSLIRYLINVAILVSHQTNKTFCYFYSELQEVEVQPEDDKTWRRRLEIKNVLIILSCITWRVFCVTYFCLVSHMCLELPAAILFMLMNVSVDIIQISFAWIFYSVYCRLKSLSYALAASTERSDFTLYQYIYKSLVDITERHKSALDAFVSTSLLISIAWLSSFYND